MTTVRPQTTDEPAYSVLLPCVPESVRAARVMVTRAMCVWGLQERVGEGSTIVSELMTNVVSHTGTVLTTVAIERNSPCCVRISVADDSHIPPHVERVSSGAECGRGLQLVEGLSSRWGYDQQDSGGKVIWAELRMRPESDL
ncbi:ATP-binding protein [Streptomyces sp. NPDC020607]|uniref:ATP-binding protein n=1 Tax=Streptomyces sp. NPDC020607 TaxID=3365082 RepID=UPI00378FEF0D